MDEKFKKYLQNVYSRVFYNLAKENFESMKFAAKYETEHQDESNLFTELEAIAKTHAAKIVKDLDRLGINNSGDMLSKENEISALVNKELTEMQKELPEGSVKN